MKTLAIVRTVIDALEALIVRVKGIENRVGRLERGEWQSRLNEAALAQAVMQQRPVAECSVMRPSSAAVVEELFAELGIK